MKTSPFSPWNDAAPASPPPESASTDSLAEAAAALQDAASRLSGLSSLSPGMESAASPLAIQITVATPQGEPLAFDAATGPDLSLLP